ncbi:hypothetical protein [Mycobacterium sp. DL592]|uniref:hypothetical protein n=1 Tax=Mycobacterium sp. DL592 TaxID=2675524 RepID=UPI0014203831|nr:hypothetical protein [Mycobacterium sp. DL592]
MRFVATLLMWLVTTVLLALAVPAAWVQQNLVDGDGYAALAQKAAADPALKAAMAGELTTQVARLGTGVNTGTVSLVASTYTASSAFPGQFAQANRFAHRWLFTDSVQSSVDSQGRWVIDFAPMLSDVAFKETLSDYNITIPTSVPIPLTDNAPSILRPGALRQVATYGPWASVGLTVLAAVFALLTLFIARSRGKMLVGLGVSALLVGGLGWAAIEFGRRHLNTVLDNSSGNIRRIAEAMVNTAVNSMHQWLNISLVVGGGLVVIGVIVTLLVGLAKSS